MNHFLKAVRDQGRSQTRNLSFLTTKLYAQGQRASE